MTLKKLRKALRKRPAPVDDFFAKGSIRYKQGNRKMTLGLSVAIKRDQMIGMSFSFFGIIMAKMKITPQNVSYYEKRKGTYFEGGYEQMSRLLKIPINFEVIQNIFLARKVFPAFIADKLQINEQNYHLHYDKKEENIVLDMWLDPFLRPTKQVIFDAKRHDTLVLEYGDFKGIEKSHLPYSIHIKAKSANENVSLKILYKTVRRMSAVKKAFQYKVPDNFKKID